MARRDSADESDEDEEESSKVHHPGALEDKNYPLIMSDEEHRDCKAEFALERFKGFNFVHENPGYFNSSFTENVRSTEDWNAVKSKLREDKIRYPDST